MGTIAKTLIDSVLPDRAAIVQTLGHPAQGIINFLDSSSNTSGEPVTADIAMTYSAVWAAMRVISETVGSLPLILYRRTANNGKERARDDSRFALLHDSPNAELGASTFIETLTTHLLMQGNAFARIERMAGRPLALHPRIPTRVKVERDESQRIVYSVTDPRETVDFEDMLHPVGLSTGTGVVGNSVIKQARQSIGSAIAMDKHRGSFFGNSATPRGILQVPQRLPKEGREQLRREWDEVHRRSDNAYKIGILHGGMEFKAIGMSNEDAQFLESQQFSIQEIARWFRLPPHLLGDLSRATFSNIEQQAIEFVTYSIIPWLRRWETAAKMKLLRPQERGNLFFEFLVDGLLRGDTKSRFESYAIARQWGWLSVNEIRRFENMNPVDEGDVYLQPMNMDPAGVPPESLRAEFRKNISMSYAKIREMASAISTGLGTMSDMDQRLEQELSGLRADRSAIRAEIDKIGKNGHAAVSLETVKEASIELMVAICERRAARAAKEAQKAASRQLNRGENFVAWLEAFCDETESYLKEAIERPARAYGYVVDFRGSVAEIVAERQMHMLKVALLEAAEVPIDEFSQSVAEAATDWQSSTEERIRSWLI